MVAHRLRGAGFAPRFQRGFVMDRNDELAYMIGAVVEDVKKHAEQMEPDEDGARGLAVRLHVRTPEDWWINTGWSDYDSVHGYWIAWGYVLPDSDPDHLARDLWAQIGDAMAMNGQEEEEEVEG